MPELPEVETIRRGLNDLLVGKKITSVSCIDSPKSFPNDPEKVRQFVNGAHVIAVRRRAKVLFIDLDTHYTLMVHLKMTGQLVFVGTNRWGGGHPSDSLVGALPDRFTRVIISFDDTSQLFFNDLRKFGWMKLLPTAEIPTLPFMQRVGPEPLDSSLTSRQFIERVRRHNNTCIKAAILNQAVIAGVGNIYADESLWAAYIHPATRVSKLSDEQLQKLLHCIQKVMQLSIDNGGSTDKNYVDAEGRKGNYLSFANVFRREGLACKRHPGVLVEKIRVAGRGTHICPVCQVEVV
ncbi:MAG: bifunctional DNA-formamidopyrimidine glycosylase/DNA-(apurinic or apyrimidinic site) lyase [Candidatus Saccharimonas sp.]